MPIKRRTPKGRAHKVTPEAIEAFQTGDYMGVHRALGLRPWETSPLDADTPEPPEWAVEGDLWAQGWETARELRAALTEAAAA
ncbi:hypothetical protein ACSSV6_000569 [Roseovarius sp. MBR-38]|jgi:hypothetical protein